MPALMQPGSRYASAEPKRLPDGSVILDPLSRRRLHIDDFPGAILRVTVRPGDSPFSLASRLYGSSKFYWVVCECVRQDNPFLPLIPGDSITLPTDHALREYQARNEQPE